MTESAVARSFAYQALIANGVATQIETLVAQLIGVAPVAILDLLPDEPEEDDAD